MIYLKKFEKYERKVKYKYLNEEDTDKLQKFVDEFFNKLNIQDKIDSLKYRDFTDDDFDYWEMFLDIIGKVYSGSSDTNNIYWAVDTFTSNNNMICSPPESRNSLHTMLINKYEQLDVENKLNEKLIKIFEKSPNSYSKRFKFYEEQINTVVKNACKWMLDYKKYNL